MKITENLLKDILAKFSDKKILIIGDIMLDNYIIGDVDRISPEAPVQVVKVEQEEFRLGGAANVANNIKSLGAMPLLVGRVGNDSAGKQVLSLLDAKDISTQGIFIDDSYPTTRKSRVIARHQHLLRIDFENTDDLSHTFEQTIKEYIAELMPEVDGVILQDYNKGMLSQAVIKSIIKLSSRHKKIIGVDPKAQNFFEYKNATLFKPNRREISQNLNVVLQNNDELVDAAKKLQKKLTCKYVVVTLGEKGAFVYQQDDQYWQIPTFSQEIYDVSGAGDTVISTLILCLASDCDIRTAAIIANHAAGVVCGKVGVATASQNEIIRSFRRWEGKI
ncbi:MAG: D-glycero-beta-D-manno-heptose-7-phosphate kinase [Candidatus Cloacimonadia bacterium]